MHFSLIQEEPILFIMFYLEEWNICQFIIFEEESIFQWDTSFFSLMKTVILSKKINFSSPETKNISKCLKNPPSSSPAHIIFIM